MPDQGQTSSHKPFRSTNTSSVKMSPATARVVVLKYHFSGIVLLSENNRFARRLLDQTQPGPQSLVYFVRNHCDRKRHSLPRPDSRTSSERARGDKPVR